MPKVSHTTQSVATLHEQLGGPRLFSRTTWLIGVAVALLVVVSEAIEIQNLNGLYLCAVSLVCLSLTRVFQLLLKSFGDKRKIDGAYPWFIIYLATTVTSLIVFVPIFIFVDIVNIPSNSFTYAQFPQALIAGTAWTFLVVVILDMRDRVSEQISEEMREHVRRDQINFQYSMIAAEINRQVQNEIEIGLADGRHHLEALSAQLEDLTKTETSLSSQIRSISNESVRSFSHRLITEDEQKLLKPGLFNLVKETIMTQPFRTFDMALILIFTFLVSQIQQFGFVDGVSLLAVGLAAFFGICSTANLLMAKFPAWRLTIYFGAFCLLQINTITTDAIRREWGADYITAPYFVVEVIFSALLVLVTSAFPVWRKKQFKIVSLLQRSIDAASREIFVRNSYLAKMTREAAYVMHGSVQSRLQACAMSIDQALEANNPDEVARALHSARSALSRPVSLDSSEDCANHEASLVAEVKRKIDLWKDLIAISVRVVPEATLVSGHLATTVGRIVEETLSNAVRHGVATSIAVDIEVTDRDVRITVFDNGRGLADKVKVGQRRGVGLSFIDSQTSGKWSLASTESQTVFQASVSISEPDSLFV